MSTGEDDVNLESIPKPASTSTPNPEVGAKRRKPQKTNRLTFKSEENLEEPPSVGREEVGCSDGENEDLELVTVVEPEPASDEHERLVKPVLPEVGVVEVGKDHTFKCPLCLESLSSQKDFTVHIRAHNEVKPSPDPNDPTGQAKVYYCCLCGKMLSSFSSLDRHMLVHSGERPFSCQLCGQTFTTNGNMHRHKRTHSARDLQLSLENGTNQVARRGGGGRKRSLPSNSSDTLNKNIKLNKNNSIGSEQDPVNMGRGRGGRTRKLPQHKENKSSIDCDSLSTMGLSLLRNVSDNSCFVCKETFITESAMEAHILTNHPNENALSNECNILSPNFSFLKLQRNMFHFANSHNIIKSDDNRISNEASLDSQIAQTRKSSENNIPNLKLQMAFKNENERKYSTNTFQVSKDPNQEASIQSSLGNNVNESLSTSEPIFKRFASRISDQSLFAKEETAEDPILTRYEKVDTNDCESQSDSSSNYRFDNNQSSDDSPTGKGDDSVIRDMKLRGEFPCRLCSAVYPNLRALKGHNKEHLSKAPYNCNVGSCTYSSNDKSTLTRHMRTHTGEKPFECKLCSYGFTTKANCERHLKNKHGKTSRDAIKHSIIIHETEDGSVGNDLQGKEQYRCKVCKGTFATSSLVVNHAIKEHPAYASDVDHIFEEIKVKDKHNGHENDPEDDNDDDDDDDDNNNPSFADQFPLLNTIRQRLQRPSSPLGHFQSDIDSCSSSHNNDQSSPDTPLDLSRPSKESLPMCGKSDVSFAQMPLLKLQGKFPVMPPHNINIGPGSSMAAQTSIAAAVAASGLMPANFPFLFGTPPQLSCIPNAVNPTFPFLLPSFMPPSALLSNLESFPTDVKEKFQAEMKQKIQELQLNSSQVEAPPLVASSSKLSVKSTSQKDQLRKKAADYKEQAEAAEVLQSLGKIHAGSIKGFSSHQVETIGKSSGRQSPVDDNDSKYKMVIKNGVLMKKQKQRRYRTERPYSCNFCTAKFTLRSNMERHIKQQHPDNWSQKRRGSRHHHSSNVSSAPTQAEHLLRSDDFDEEEEEEEGVLDHEGSTIDDEMDEESLVIVEKSNDEEGEETADLASVSKLISSATSHSFKKFLDNHEMDYKTDAGSKEFSDTKMNLTLNHLETKKSAYSAAPHKIPCPYCSRKFPWISSLNRHILTHTGQKPYKCSNCPLWFTTKSNCDRHVVRKHGETNNALGNGSNNNNHQASTADRTLPYKCQLCPTSSFLTQISLKKHLYTNHPRGILEQPNDGGSSADDEDEDIDCFEDLGGNICEIDEGVLKGLARFRCHICRHPIQVFSNRKTALNHLRIKHCQEYDILSMQGNIEKCESLPDEDPCVPFFKPISCLFCSKSLDNPEELRNHIDESHCNNVSGSPLHSFQEKNETQQKKKRASLMDKINQLSANASSIHNTLFKQKEPEQIMVE